MGDLPGSGFRNRVSEAKTRGKVGVDCRDSKQVIRASKNNGPAVGQGEAHGPRWACGPRERVWVTHREGRSGSYNLVSELNPDESVESS
ncbi:unnamed protein product [Microthlaspi erraticum]|uniref:Uncharacterized protein n=1 Tax=Microthlaspi erraticum TaxID=1685480 RepID=A0A6D2IKT0_9BRAS|nr:unnamed protein product [Microthlaspi erraticum]